jgi:hypothetical protein
MTSSHLRAAQAEGLSYPTGVFTLESTLAPSPPPNPVRHSAKGSRRSPGRGHPGRAAQVPGTRTGSSRVRPERRPLQLLTQKWRCWGRRLAAAPRCCAATEDQHSKDQPRKGQRGDGPKHRSHRTGSAPHALAVNPSGGRRALAAPRPRGSASDRLAVDEDRQLPGPKPVVAGEGRRLTGVPAVTAARDLDSDVAGPDDASSNGTVGALGDDDRSIGGALAANRRVSGGPGHPGCDVGLVAEMASSVHRGLPRLAADEPARLAAGRCSS